MATRKKKTAKKSKRKTVRKVTKKKAAKKTRKKTGRKKIEIDWKEFDKLCALGCLLEEIAAWFDCSDDTIERRVKEDHGIRFAEYYRQKRGKGDIALRRKQMQVALKGDKTMLIWLGKNRLGQTDRRDVTTGDQAFRPAQVVVFPDNGRGVEEGGDDGD